MAASKSFAALAALSLAAAPAAAAPRTAPAPAPQTVEASALRGGKVAYWALPVLIVIALLIALLNEEEPDSP